MHIGGLAWSTWNRWRLHGLHLDLGGQSLNSTRILFEEISSSASVR